MATETKITKDSQNKKLTVERVFYAPRKKVWDGWTKAENIAKWWGPDGWPVSQCVLDLQVGGEWRYCLRSTQGQEHWVTATYKAIVEPSKLVYLNAFTDEQGNRVQDTPDPALVTVLFDAVDSNSTKVTVHFDYQSADDLRAVMAFGMEQGFTQTLNNLSQWLVNNN